MPVRNWATIRKLLINKFNPTVIANFGSEKLSDDDTALKSAILIEPNDSSLIVSSKLALYYQRFPIQSYAAVPEWWQIRLEANRPQMIFMFAQKLGESNFDSPKYPITIAHPIVKHYQESPIPDYQKGQWEAMLTLKDNSKLIINAISLAEAQKVLDACKAIIQPEFLEGAIERPIAPRRGPPLLEIHVSPRRVDYFSAGLKNTKPDWTDTFK